MNTELAKTMKTKISDEIYTLTDFIEGIEKTIRDGGQNEKQFNLLCKSLSTVITAREVLFERLESLEKTISNSGPFM